MERVIIEKQDLIGNINIIKEYVKSNAPEAMPKIIGVVKGNGYGLGIVELARILVENGIDMLAVSKVDEAIKLRENEIEVPILMLSSTSIPEELEVLIKNNITLTIGSIRSLRIANEVAKAFFLNADFHLAIETGFSRHGIDISEMDEFLEELPNMTNLKFIGIFTHFTNSFAENLEQVEMQYKRFMEAVAILEKHDINDVMKHICNSAATFRFPKYYLDAVRVGSALVGRMQIDNEYGLHKIGKFETQITETKNIKAGSTIGYTTMTRVKENTKIGIVQVGYTSGIALDVQNNVWRKRDIFRNAWNILKKLYRKNEMYASVGEEKYKVLSNVRMNNIIIDITNSTVKVGDNVVFDINPIMVDSSIERKYV